MLIAIFMDYGRQTSKIEVEVNYGTDISFDKT